MVRVAAVIDRACAWSGPRLDDRCVLLRCTALPSIFIEPLRTECAEDGGELPAQELRIARRREATCAGF
ncbi:hypothetical protein [Kallotenue papyrolyticum]|uniref:hypothetical protein n=1 Tax=Kallotenue papyrolyticum TaxID=1325125 RepID=UPI0004925C8B|nr:hypothetical protein [Kallotenue papyrolyticum]